MRNGSQNGSNKKDVAKTRQATAYVQYYDSPCARDGLGVCGEALCPCDWNMDAAPANKRFARRLNAEFAEHPRLSNAKKQLEDYFACRRKAFDIPLRLVGTDFQQQVWEILSAYHTETVSYKDIRPER